ncbi:hypothetical protein, partial [Methanosphaera stadtmanae]|uniref:hypothetical protein n=1 Tax=Methanosphaera stadtmanae TaxID=2317 RepID=UPI0026DCE61E
INKLTPQSKKWSWGSPIFFYHFNYHVEVYIIVKYDPHDPHLTPPISAENVTLEIKHVVRFQL